MPILRERDAAPEVVLERSVAVLRGLAEVQAVAVIGSVARGDARPDSDIDLLVVTDQPVRTLVAALPDWLRRSRVSLIVRSASVLDVLAREGSVFLRHVCAEGVVLHDPRGVLGDVLALARSIPIDPAPEIERRADSLRHLRDLDRFGGRFQFVLADLYAIGKGIAVAWCAVLDHPTFVKHDALTQVAEARPELSDATVQIQRLRPFYDRARGHKDQSAPFNPIGARVETERALAAVERLAAAAPR